MLKESVPLEPFTTTHAALISTVTPEEIFTGCFPIRDIEREI